MVKKEEIKEFKYPIKKQPFYCFLKPFLKLIYKKPKIINLAGKINNQSIILANHSAKSGPVSLDLYFPIKTVKWGAFQMFGNYNMRRSYLKDIFYIQKCKASKFKATILSTIFAAFNQYVYKGMWMMPTFPDIRLTKTLRYSNMVLNEDVPVMIFPENSNDGYKDVLTEFFPGFVMLSDKFYKENKIDLPIYPIYYSTKKHILVIGKQLYVQKLKENGFSKEEICKKFCEEVNNLYFEYVCKKI